MKKSQWIGVVTLTLCFLASAVLADTFSAAGDPYLPYGDPDNPNGGLGLEIIRAAFKTQGHEVTMEYVPWARAESGIKNGTYDILPFTWRTDARAKVMLFGTAYAVGNVRFIKRKGDPFEFNGLESLKGKLVGTVRGYEYGDAFGASNMFHREDAKELMTNIKQLLRQRLDLTLEDEIVARSIINSKDPEALKGIEFVKNPLSVNPLYITVGLQNPRAQEIIGAFNRGLDIIRINGTYDKIFKKYGMERAGRYAYRYRIEDKVHKFQLQGSTTGFVALLNKSTE
jgi:polar amino acid transport system substrate-binding protein